MYPLTYYSIPAMRSALVQDLPCLLPLLPPSDQCIYFQWFSKCSMINIQVQFIYVTHTYGVICITFSLHPPPF